MLGELEMKEKFIGWPFSVFLFQEKWSPEDTSNPPA